MYWPLAILLCGDSCQLAFLLFDPFDDFVVHLRHEAVEDTVDDILGRFYQLNVGLLNDSQYLTYLLHQHRDLLGAEEGFDVFQEGLLLA